MLINSSELKNLVARYDAAVSAVKQYCKSVQDLDMLVGKFNKGISALKQGQKFYANEADNLKELNSVFWHQLLYASGVLQNVDSKFLLSLDRMVKEIGTVDFTEENILQMVSTFKENAEPLMNDAIMRVFEWLCYFAYRKASPDGNRDKFQSYWKTNKIHKVGKKIIIPDVLYQYSNIKEWSMNENMQQEINDFDKVLCWLSGKDFTTIKSLWIALCNVRKHKELFGQKFETEFFVVKVFKKGTVHLEFLDLKLLADFNAAAAKLLGNRLGGK